MNREEITTLARMIVDNGISSAVNALKEKGGYSDGQAKAIAETIYNEFTYRSNQSFYQAMVAVQEKIKEVEALERFKCDKCGDELKEGHMISVLDMNTETYTDFCCKCNGERCSCWSVNQEALEKVADILYMDGESLLDDEGVDEEVAQAIAWTILDALGLNNEIRVQVLEGCVETVLNLPLGMSYRTGHWEMVLKLKED